MTRFISALNKKRASFGNSEKGFTLIELLVVVIIIGILAAIAIPVYIGVQNNAKNGATTTDLANGKLAVVAYVSDKGAYPLTVNSTTLSNYGYTGSVAENTNPAGTGTATTFCLKSTSASGTAFYVTAGGGPTSTKPAGCL